MRMFEPALLMHCDVVMGQLTISISQDDIFMLNVLSGKHES